MITFLLIAVWFNSQGYYFFFPSEKTIYEDYGERIFFTQWEPSLAANAGKRNEERDLRNVLMGVKGVKPHWSGLIHPGEENPQH